MFSDDSPGGERPHSYRLRNQPSEVASMVKGLLTIDRYDQFGGGGGGGGWRGGYGVMGG